MYAPLVVFVRTPSVAPLKSDFKLVRDSVATHGTLMSNVCNKCTLINVRQQQKHIGRKKMIVAKNKETTGRLKDNKHTVYARNRKSF
jgi:hypothetical protein